jgi:hypothetical protein
MPTARIFLAAQTTFGDYPGTVSALNAGTIEQATPEVGDTLTVSGSNVPSDGTILWQVDTGSGFGAAGGTNNAASYDTTGQPAGDYRRGVSTPAQAMVYTAAVELIEPAAFTYADSRVSTNLSNAVWGSQTLSSGWWLAPGTNARADTDSVDFTWSAGTGTGGRSPPNGITLTAVADVRKNASGSANMRLWNVTSGVNRNQSFNTNTSGDVDNTTHGQIDLGGSLFRIWIKVDVTATAQRIVFDVPSSSDANHDYRTPAIFEGSLTPAEIEALV